MALSAVSLRADAQGAGSALAPRRQRRVAEVTRDHPQHFALTGAALLVPSTPTSKRDRHQAASLLGYPRRGRTSFPLTRACVPGPAANQSRSMKLRSGLLLQGCEAARHFQTRTPDTGAPPSGGRSAETSIFPRTCAGSASLLRTSLLMKPESFSALTRSYRCQALTLG